MTEWVELWESGSGCVVELVGGNDWMHRWS